eukprot:CAMPEP_0184478390 /NCGR_PEP_ID=MMETSP0113_2-20130426/436_1 /TAXON_ID=91329 /ORGANISM="Norrisiella sphaerica, Strain BC52" /LENGTH=71 /DNA_ID=CAMNT_0026856165 /DNA_START=178 /DNA_END=390 /DNA_ORIENTATION=+
MASYEPVDGKHDSERLEENRSEVQMNAVDDDEELGGLPQAPENQIPEPINLQEAMTRQPVCDVRLYFAYAW